MKCIGVGVAGTGSGAGGASGACSTKCLSGAGAGFGAGLGAGGADSTTVLYGTDGLGGGFMAAAPYGDCLIMTPGGTPASGLARATVWAGGATSSVTCPLW